MTHLKLSDGPDDGVTMPCPAQRPASFTIGSSAWATDRASTAEPHNKASTTQLSVRIISSIPRTRRPCGSLNYPLDQGNRHILRRIGMGAACKRDMPMAQIVHHRSNGDTHHVCQSACKQRTKTKHEENFAQE